MYRLFFAILGISSILMILIKVRKNKFSESRSIFWVAGGIVMLFLSIFPKTIDVLSQFLGINHPPSLLFLLASIFIIYSVFKLEEEITQTREQMKDLAHRNAILETRLKEKNK
jgi:hypothetical protein